MTTLTPTHLLLDLTSMLSASCENYNACIGHVAHQHTCSGVTATTRMHYLKFDGNGQPKMADLAKCLAEHIMEYAVSSRNRPILRSSQDWAKFHNEVRRLFRVNATARGMTPRGTLRGCPPGAVVTVGLPVVVLPGSAVACPSRCLRGCRRS